MTKLDYWRDIGEEIAKPRNRDGDRHPTPWRHRWTTIRHAARTWWLAQELIRADRHRQYMERINMGDDPTES